jgi:hypothetical protein
MAAQADSFLYALIESRMKMRGYDRFSMEAVKVRGTGAGVNLMQESAPNEFLYLVSATVPADLRIESATNSWADGANYANQQFVNYQEFSGDVVMSFSGIVDIEFIRVVPE